MKLHAISLTQYDAVILLDNDVSVRGSLKSLWDCAASGKLLTTRGTWSNVNGAFLAVKPNVELFERMLAVLQNSTVSSGPEGWNGYGWGPVHKDDFRMQGFMYHFFHQR